MLYGEAVEGFDETLLFDADAKPQHERSWNRQRHYGIFICGFKLLLRQGLYSELLLSPDIAPLPNSPPHFCGLTNVRGNLVPVYRLAPWLGREQPSEPSQLVLVVDQPHRGAALVVDAKPQALNVAALVEMDEVPDAVVAPMSPMIEKAYLHSDDVWLLVNHDALFSQLAVDGAENMLPFV